MNGLTHTLCLPRLRGTNGLCTGPSHEPTATYSPSLREGIESKPPPHDPCLSRAVAGLLVLRAACHRFPDTATRDLWVNLSLLDTATFMSGGQGQAPGAGEGKGYSDDADVDYDSFHR